MKLLVTAIILALSCSMASADTKSFTDDEVKLLAHMLMQPDISAKFVEFNRYATRLESVEVFPGEESTRFVIKGLKPYHPDDKSCGSAELELTNSPFEFGFDTLNSYESKLSVVTGCD